ncbi:PQQ-binding-like beta-propeller repeat protein [Streptomyces litchfieldiae]|uniref:Pyrroloquinoline-quinone binding quinoprotein n=1 Tax=Streptomyces litchfieldiae TaxID=3075543 RepID=A0ABU2MIW1_9ACTN|nr:hypothetical protein [Streptomyces sp. DSM 44938]MDT0341541.1 hypothetical protein [Streptomyces sp. DSM 44938]
MRVRNGWPVALLAGTLVLGGCGGDGGSGREDSADERPAEESPEPAGPPTEFATEPAARIDTGPITHPPLVVHGERAWVADEAGLNLVDLTTGRATARVDTEEPARYEPWRAEGATTPEEEAAAAEQAAATRRVVAPLLAELDGEPAVLAAIPVGDDSAPELELVAAHAETGDVLARVPFTPAFWREEAPDGQVSARVVSVHEGLVAIQPADGNQLAGAVVVDLARREVAWESDDFALMAGHGDTLAGVASRDDGSATVGVALADGREVWSDPIAGAPSLQPMGRLFRIQESEDPAGPRLVETATGEPVITADDGLAKDMTCTPPDPEITAVVCDNEESGALAFDLESGEVLWRQPAGEAGRDGTWSGEVTASYRDRIYLDRDGRPVVLDARSGEVVAADSGVAPQVVAPGAALIAAGDHVDIHPARTD